MLRSLGCSRGQKETQLILSYILQSYIPSKSSWICRIPRLPLSIPEVHGHERAHKYLLVSRFPISIWAEVTACKQWAGRGWYSAPAPDTPLCPRTCYTAAVFEGITPPGPAPSSRPLPAGPRARLGRLTSVVLSGGWRPVVDTLFTSVSPSSCTIFGEWPDYCRSGGI